MKIRQEINILTDVRSIAAAADGNERIRINTADYNGTVTYTLELYANNTNATATAVVVLRRQGTTTNDATINIPNNTTNFTWFTATISVPAAAATIYMLRINTAGTGNIRVGRVIVSQDTGASNLTTTSTQVELGNAEATKTNATTGATTTVNAPLLFPKYWKYVAADWDGTLAVWGEAATSHLSSMDTLVVAIQEDNGSLSSWTDKLTIYSGTTNAVGHRRSASSFTPVDGRTYRIACRNSSGANNYSTFNGKLIVNQTGTSITKLQAEYLLNNSEVTATGMQNMPNRYYSADWTTAPVFKFAMDGIGSSHSMRLVNTPSTVVTGSTVSGTNQQISSAITLTNAAVMDSEHVSGTGAPGGSRILAQVGGVVQTPPTVTTSAGTSIGDNAFTANGNITSIGSVNPTVRGFCYMLGNSGDPTLADTVVQETGSYSTGAYTLSISSLIAGTDYRVRAFATNSGGTSYGTSVTVTTTGTPPAVSYLGTPDNFNDNTLATQWDPSTSTNRYMISEKNQRLEIVHSNTNYNTILMTTGGDLTGKEMRIKVVDAGAQNSGYSHTAQFVAYKDANNKFYMEATGGELKAYKLVAGTQTQIGTAITYVPATHLYWRIRESSGTIYFDTSADFNTWTNRFSATVASIFAVNSGIKAGLSSGNWQNNVAHASYAYFDDFNGGGAPDNDTFTWKGYTWQRRQAFEGGGPSYNGQYLPANATVDGNGYLNLALTNPASSPYGSEVKSVSRGFGYGTYTAIYQGNFSAMHKSIVFGGLYIYDEDTTPTNNEIDVGEISAWDNLNGNVKLNHTYFTNVGGNKTSVESSLDPIASGTTYPVMTHRMIWSATSIIWDSFGGTASAGWTHLKRTTQTNSLPVPALERCHFNIWVFEKTDTQVQTATPSSATPITAIVQDFSFAASTSDPGQVLPSTIKPAQFMPFLTGF